MTFINFLYIQRHAFNYSVVEYFKCEQEFRSIFDKFVKYSLQMKEYPLKLHIVSNGRLDLPRYQEPEWGNSGFGITDGRHESGWRQDEGTARTGVIDRTGGPGILPSMFHIGDEHHAEN